jgi:hypothetical protein
MNPNRQKQANSGGEIRPGRAACGRSRKSPDQIPESIAVWSEATEKKLLSSPSYLS